MVLLRSAGSGRSKLPRKQPTPLAAAEQQQRTGLTDGPLATTTRRRCTVAPNEVPQAVDHRCGTHCRLAETRPHRGRRLDNGLRQDICRGFICGYWSKRISRTIDNRCSAGLYASHSQAGRAAVLSSTGRARRKNCCGCTMGCGLLHMQEAALFPGCRRFGAPERRALPLRALHVKQRVEMNDP